MTRKHFAAIASAIAEEYEMASALDEKECEAVRAALASLAGSLGTVCKQSNPNFDRTRFYRAAIPA